MSPPARPPAARSPFLGALGRAVRHRREERELTREALAERSGVSVRFLAQLEGGQGNISVERLAEVAGVLRTTAAALLRQAEPAPERPRVVALLGLRGAGKSTLGPRLAARLGATFVELDREVERRAGLSLGEVFELQGEAFYRRLEREALRAQLGGEARLVLATGGGLVTAPETFELLRREAWTVWLRARPEDHLGRVRAQDDRPLRDRPDAMAELRALLRARAPLYAQCDAVVDTSTLSVDGALDAVVTALGG